ncbi:uncharacterized protein LOC114316085 [Camellia sinensis]|uniref:uncharacterized protein LOC114316085 n=1 Tax=Camellia sinensis TaxID=4442 RepID=UPI00103675DB|nr:uncharacterized protein LOC114316085 [Camellia sinensis]
MEKKPIMQQLAKNVRRMSLSDDSAMMKQIQGTHSPDGRDVYAKPNLQVIEDILNHVTPDVADNPVYLEEYFRRRFRMRRSLFVSILHNIQQMNEYFIQTRDTTGTPGLSSVHKMTAALRILQYVVHADVVDEYIRIGESTAIAALNFFTRSIVATYEAIDLKSPNEADVARLFQEGEQRGFLGMSPLFAELIRGRAPAANYTITNHAYTMGIILLMVSTLIGQQL